MFTRCPACETTFRLGANDLRQAQGRVRCGECSSVFNALAYLAEEPEAAARPENWLPEPANDAMHPDESSALPAPAAEANAEHFDFDFILDESPDEEDEFDTAIFVTEPDDDGQYYQTRASGAAEVRAPSATEQISNPDANIAADRPEAENTVFDDDEGTIEFPTPLDLDTEPETEGSSTALWNQALQQHEIAETGLDLTAASRNDFLSAEELDEADANDSLTINQPAMPIEPAAGQIAAEEDFDDTIWERIPGVGSADDTAGRPVNIEPLRSPWVDEPQAPAGGPVDAHSDDDPLEFNAPEETWSKIFVRGSTVTQDPEDDGYPELYADDPEEDLEDSQGSDHPEDQDDLAQLERIFNPERIAAAMQERVAARAALAALSASAPVENSGVEAADDDPTRQDAMAVWLTDEDVEDDTEVEPDEFPAEGYDVQHIILADESEALPEQASDNSRADVADPDATLPPWRNTQEEQPQRSGLWLTGGLVLVAALAIQLIHYNRDTLATNPVWGNAITNMYALAGMDISPKWSIDDYEIRSAEAVTGESGPDIMDIRAQIAVVGDRPTGYPYLRVVLSDRWSKPVAEKTFGPKDYIADKTVNDQGLMNPGQTIEAHIGIVDPGEGAQGFELELCLPRRHTGMECTGQTFK